MRRMLTEKDVKRMAGEGVEITPESLLETFEGSASVTVDLNEAGTKVQVKLDQDVVDEIDSKLDASKSAVSTVGGLVVPTVTPTADELVGIDTTGGQARITIGDGLEIDENGVLNVVFENAEGGSY